MKRRAKELKAFFEEAGIHVETRWETFWRWLKDKFSNFGTLRLL